jgi:hypothetical protein
VNGEGYLICREATEGNFASVRNELITINLQRIYLLVEFFPLTNIAEKELEGTNKD